MACLLKHLLQIILSGHFINFNLRKTMSNRGLAVWLSLLSSMKMKI